MGARVDTGGGRKGLTPDINVTPLVDVVLVLLIIFMVVLPDMSDSGKKVDLVKVDQADQPSGIEPLAVTIDRDEMYTMGEQDLARDAMLAELRTLHAQDGRRPVLLRADASLPYRVVRDFFAEVREIGFERIGLAVGVNRQWSAQGQGG